MKRLALSSWIMILVSLLLLSFIALPFVNAGIFFGHDIYLHTVYVQKFYEAFSQGQLPVRVIDWIFPGFNQPLFTFYQPGFYYLTVLFKLLHFSTSDAIKITSLGLWVVGGVGMFLFTKRKAGLAGGLIASIFYTFAPYHIVDIFVRAALPEFAALSIVPFLFLGIDGMFTSANRFYWWLTSLSIAVLLLFHPPTALMFLPLAGLYCLYFLIQKDRVRNILKLLLVTSIGFLISAFFLLPAFFEKQFIFLQKAATGNYDFHNHFVCFSQLLKTDWGYGFSVPGCNDTMPFAIGSLHIFFVLVLVIFLLVFLIQKKWRREFWLLGIFIAIFFFSLFMTGFWSKLVWEKIPFLTFVQYPWRFLSVGIFTASFLTGYAVFLLPDSLRFRSFIAIVALVCILYVPYVHPLTYYSQQSLVFDKNGFTNYSDYVNAKHDPESFYDPTTAIKRVTPATIYSQITFEKKGNILEEKTTAAAKTFIVTMPQEQSITLYVRYFPGWNITLDGKVSHVMLDSYGYVHLHLPAGKHTIIASYTQTRLEKLSNYITVFAFVASFLFFLPIKRKVV
ncbi:MAG TPA: 6-pyruvoyl-tetrahydropterin synthase-related protein [Patescibacteria group bacterium]